MLQVKIELTSKEKKSSKPNLSLNEMEVFCFPSSGLQWPGLQENKQKKMISGQNPQSPKPNISGNKWS